MISLYTALYSMLILLTLSIKLHSRMSIKWYFSQPLLRHHSWLKCKASLRVHIASTHTAMLTWHWKLRTSKNLKLQSILVWISSESKKLPFISNLSLLTSNRLLRMLRMLKMKMVKEKTHKASESPSTNCSLKNRESSKLTSKKWFKIPTKQINSSAFYRNWSAKKNRLSMKNSKWRTIWKKLRTLLMGTLKSQAAGSGYSNLRCRRIVGCYRIKYRNLHSVGLSKI